MCLDHYSEVMFTYPRTARVDLKENPIKYQILGIIFIIILVLGAQSKVSIFCFELQ